MVSDLESIKKPIEKEMKSFETIFRDSMRTKVSLLDRVMMYIVKRKGKQIRPMLVFLSAGTAGVINDRTYRGASLVELLHTATLIHDDVVDDSFQRRGMFSINAIWKNKIAVLVGDYLLARGLLLSVDNEDHDLLKISSNTVKLMSEGEMYQLEKSRSLDLTEEEYYNVIRMKTASLIASCCAMGTQSVTEDKELVEQMRLFGEYVGMAFQIKDDLFDYGSNASGKPTGIDIQEKKLTLPLIYALDNSTKSEKRSILKKVRKYKGTKSELNEIFEIVKSKNGITYAENKMKEYQNKAFQILHSYPKNEYRESLEALVRYTTERIK